MTNLDSLSILLISTFTIAAVHALAPDHWLPFVSIGRAQKWSRKKLTWVVLISGLGHVGSSVVIGIVGLVLGLSLASLESIESQRAQIAGLLLIGFGLAYAIWGIKHVRDHHHAKLDPKRSVTIWTIIAIFVLGPCEPLIPLMFISAAHSWMAVWLVSLVFGGVTILMMVGQAQLANLGVRLLWLRKAEHYTHAAAGMVIAMTGGVVMLLGI